ncbi:hypothetical protein N0V90_004532 [Kalmusia sp. IMI 367209]|nr:hypothetical protein N0V90_004532 [Kalmusia sp. IMI 367209]
MRLERSPEGREKRERSATRLKQTHAVQEAWGLLVCGDATNWLLKRGYRAIVPSKLTPSLSTYHNESVVQVNAGDDGDDGGDVETSGWRPEEIDGYAAEPPMSFIKSNPTGLIETVPCALLTYVEFAGRVAGAHLAHDLNQLDLTVEDFGTFTTTAFNMYHGLDVLERRRTAPMGDRGTVINIVSWLLTVVAICVLTARFTMRLSIKDKARRFGLDDLFISLAFLFSIAQTIAVSVESIQALGQHINDLTPGQTEYAGCILYIANMGCARISLCLLIKNILPGSTARITALVFAAFTALWTVSGILVASFACSPPDPWQWGNGKKCIDVVSWVNYVGSTNIIVEVLLISIPLCIWNVRTSAGRRMSVSLLFLARLSIVAAVGAQLHFFNARRTGDVTYDYWRTVLCIQIAQNLSVITACLPSLHPFIVKMLAGSIKNENIKQFVCPRKDKIIAFFTRRKAFDPMSSQSSSIPIRQEKEEEYCAPLATYGLDRSSAHLTSPQFNRFPVNAATPVESPNPPENVFMRSVEIPSVSRQSSLRRPSTIRNSRGIPQIPEIPKSLAEVGVLPLIDYDTDSSISDRGSGTSSQASRRPPSEYIFNRSKVISVPEESHLREQREEGQYFKKYYPPLPSPKAPRKPPRAF